MYKYLVRVDDVHNLILFIGLAFIFKERGMLLSDYIKLRILSSLWQGFKISKIVVLADATVISGQSVRLFLKHFTERGTIARKPGSGLTLKLLPTILQIVESAMQENDETTATQLQAKLAAHGCYVLLSTIMRNRCQLEWVYCASAYCQLIKNANKQSI